MTKKTALSISTDDNNAKVSIKRQINKELKLTREQWKSKIESAAKAYKALDNELAELCKEKGRSALAATVNGLTNKNTSDNSEVAKKGRLAAKKLNILNRYIELTLQQHETKDFDYDVIRKWYIHLLK